MKCVLTQVQPYCNRAAVAMPREMSRVQTDEARPYSESLAQRTASSASSNRVTETTGPEDFMLDDFVALQRAGHHGWLVEKPPPSPRDRPP